MYDVPKVTIRESNFPTLYICPFCEGILHFADGFVFCIGCSFARHEDRVKVVREFPVFPIPSTKNWYPNPTYYCVKCNGRIVDPAKHPDHADHIRVYVRKYHFNGGTHATFRIYPFRKLPSHHQAERGK